MYENRTMTPTEIALRRGDREQGGAREAVNLIRVDCVHVCKYHNEISLYN
jgi:hypothetical protein